jgi:hypothetical protein
MINLRIIAVILAVCICFPIVAISQVDPWATYYENSGCKATPRYDETVAFCRRLDEASPWVKYTTFGISPQGRRLPMLILDRNGYTDPVSVKNSGNLVLMIQAGIHPGEIDGKDAGLMLFRDIAVRQQHLELLEHVTILFIPIFNVDGHERFGPYNRINQDGPEEMGWRTTAQNLNLNRDYLKADAPEMQAWLKLFQQWLPDFIIDIHATDGADYQYASTFGLELLGNMDAALTTWAGNTLIPAMEEQMDSVGYPVFPYVMFRKWHDPRSGLRAGVGGPRFSTGYLAVQNRIGLLVENHMLKDYKTRVTATYELLKTVTDLLNNEAAMLMDLNGLADKAVASPAFRSEDFPVDFVSTGDSIMVKFRGVEYEVEKSDLTGGDWFRYHPDQPVEFNLPYFREHKTARSVKLPEAYIYPPEWSQITERLPLHGIAYKVLASPVRLQVQSFKFRNYTWNSQPFEGRISMTTEWDTLMEVREYPAGSVVIDMNQRCARAIACIFEPASEDSYLSWGFFNSIFEQKEYFETYVMEDMARKMIEEQPELKAEFELWKSENAELSKNQYVALHWFYQRSPYWDKSKDVYPVGKILERSEFEKLPLE